MHWLTHRTLKITVQIVESDDVFLNRHVGISLKIVYETIDVDHIFTGVAVEMFLEVGINQHRVLIMKPELRNVLDGAMAKVEKHRETS